MRICKKERKKEEGNVAKQEIQEDVSIMFIVANRPFITLT